MTDLDVFKLDATGDADGCFRAWGMSRVVSNEVKKIGGRKELAKILNFPESAVRDWECGRAPVPLFALKKLSTPFSFEKKHVVLGVKRSRLRVKVPLKVDSDFAYWVGLILGDGSLAGPGKTVKGAWRIHFCGENRHFVRYYGSIAEKLFGIKAHFRHVERQNKNYFEAVFASKVVHRLLTSVFEVPAGVKCYSIKRPDIFTVLTEDVKASFLRGLFDTDGSVVGNKIKFATTSASMRQNIVEDLEQLGLSPRVYEWKKGVHATIYDVWLVRKADVKRFCQLVGSSHPRKAILLARIISSW